MIARFLQPVLLERLGQFPAVALLGPRQAGKTTLALEVAKTRGDGSVYLDLENPADRRRLEDASAYLAANRGRLIILDEIHRAPETFPVLRSEIDARRRAGEKAGQFLVLGSAALDLLRQTSESLAGRISFLELPPFQPQELEHRQDSERLWLRGGFPESFLAADDRASLAWRQAFIRSYLERDIPQFGIRIPAETLERFWTMLAHNQGCLLNAQGLSRSLGVSWHTTAHYLDLMVDLLLTRRLQPWQANIGKRLVKSPKIYLRDSGIVHALLNLPSVNEVLGHPVAGASWEGFALEAILSAAPAGAKPFFYRSAAGHEIDLVLELSASRRWAFEFKKSSAPAVERGFHVGADDVGAQRKILVYPGNEIFPAKGGIEAMPLLDAVRALADA